MSRFDQQPAPPLVQSAYWFETNDAPLLHHDLTLADLAHLFHLHEQSLIRRDIAQTLMRLVLELDRDAHFAYDPANGDAFTNREQWLAVRAPDAVGYYSTGRARREATTVAFRLTVRRALFALARLSDDLQSTLLRLTARHVETVMPDYTYLQQAQPTTFAHYLLSFVFPLRRDFARARETFALINQSPAGIGSTNGSRLPLRRERLAELLGFDGVITHTRDAMWQVDAPIQVLNTATTLLLHLDRLAEDLQIFNSIEFGFVELADEFARASVIMPQKKNPYSLAFIRGAAGELIGRVTEMYVIARTPSAQVDNRIFAHGAVPRALDLATRCAYLMGQLCENLVIHSDKMRAWVEAGFTQATDLAETLTQECGLDYATAHQIVARVVRELLPQNKTSRDITPALLDTAAREIIGRDLNLSDAKLADALDSRAILATRNGIGGAAPARIREMIDECRADEIAQRVWVDQTDQRIRNAEKSLIEMASEFATQPA
jgi:argininosuccinate lyase